MVIRALGGVLRWFDDRDELQFVRREPVAPEMWVLDRRYMQMHDDMIYELFVS